MKKRRLRVKTYKEKNKEGEPTACSNPTGEREKSMSKSLNSPTTENTCSEEKSKQSKALEAPKKAKEGQPSFKKAIEGADGGL